MILQKPVRLLLEYARPEILTTFKPRSCVASTAVGIRVLQRFGIESWPVPVHMVAMNAAYVDMMNEAARNKERYPDGTMPEDEQMQWVRRGAWSVEISDQGLDDGFGGGHLVLGIKGYLVDLSIDQASRPQKAMPLAPLAIECPPDFYSADDRRIFREVGTAYVVYRRSTDPNSLEYLQASRDWTNKDGRLDEIIQRTERKIRKSLNQKKRR